MNSTVQQESLLQCQKHGQKVIQIVLDNNCLPDDRMLCLECIELSRQPYNRVIGVTQAKEMIKERILQQNAEMKEKSQPYLTKLTSLQQKLLTFRESQIKIIDNMIEFIQKWIFEINNHMNTNEQIELPKGIELLQQDHKEFNIQLEQNGKAYLIKLYSSFKKLLKMEGIQECKQELLNLHLNNDQIKLKEEVDVKNITQLNQQIQTQQQVVNKNKGRITYKQINQVKQQQDCSAIAFNKSGNIMIAGFNGNIKVWQFDKRNINQLTELKGQAEYITCLIYSKRSEWFVSGDWNGNLQLWKQGQSNKEWITSNIEKKQDFIFCIILNQQEDQLILCYKDIIVWQVNYEKNKLSYSYTLKNKHTDRIFGLSLNDSETALVSCGSDYQIILWIKGADDKWMYQNNVKMDSYLLRICFINENQFIVQQNGKGYSNVFRIKDKQLQEQKDLQIQLTDKDKYDINLFPTIYNKRNDVIIQKSINYVYIIRRDTNGQFKVQAQPIDCGTPNNYGSMTEDGHHLVIWNDKTKEFRIHKLNYE